MQTFVNWMFYGMLWTKGTIKARIESIHAAKSCVYPKLGGAVELHALCPHAINYYCIGWNSI